jgi:hypothetical protein
MQKEDGDRGIALEDTSTKIYMSLQCSASVLIAVFFTKA